MDVFLFPTFCCLDCVHWGKKWKEHGVDLGDGASSQQVFILHSQFQL